MSADTLKLRPLLDAINAHLSAALGPATLHAADHQRFTAATPLPAALTEITDITLLDPHGDDGTERLCVALVLSTFVVYTSAGDERENRIAVRALALRLAQSLRYKFSHACISQPKITDIATDYLNADGDNASGSNNAALIECQRIDWEVEGYIGADIWADWIEKQYAEQITLGDGIPVPLPRHAHPRC